MRQQHEITTSAPLLGKDGDLLEPGWARSLLPVYRRADIKASPMRIKEWDYYLITDGHIGLALTIADNGYMGLDSISFLHFDENWEQTTSRMRALPLGKGGGSVAKAHTERMRLVEVASKWELFDVDTVEDLQTLRLYCSQGKGCHKAG